MLYTDGALSGGIMLFRKKAGALIVLIVCIS
jgi:hypothetical protein